MKSRISEALKISLRGLEPVDRLAGLLVVSMEIRHLKLTLGYIGEGSWQAYRGEIRPPWTKLCLAQAGFTEATERNLHECVQAVKARLSKSERTEARAILAMMETPPSELSDEARIHLIQGIRHIALKDGDSQEILKDEFKARASEAAEAVAAPVIHYHGPDIRRMARALSPSGENDELSIRRRDLTALGMSCGLSLERAREVALVMTDDAALSTADAQRKREIKDAARQLLEAPDSGNPQTSN